jgi:hypothetical protein
MITASSASREEELERWAPNKRMQPTATECSRGGAQTRRAQVSPWRRLMHRAVRRAEFTMKGR